MFSLFHRAPKTYPEGEFDIEGMPVFSIERDTHRDVTIIGYTRDTNVEEWNLPVSLAKHDELVRRFRAKLNLPYIASSQP